MARIKVKLRERSYEIIIGLGIIHRLSSIISRMNWGKKIFVVTDPLVNRLYGKLVRASMPCQVLLVKRGEQHKNLRVLTKLYDDLIKLGAHRDSLIIALGGGVVGDLAGFLAATYLRGLNFIQVPTTLLAQVDAAIGGKTGVNHPKGKNLIGAFYQPKMVYIDIRTLASLPGRELRAGLAEVIKYGLMDNAGLFNFLEKNALALKSVKDYELWEKIVFESAKIKAKVVARDERESRYRMVLNLGHTFAHAIEATTKYKKYTHGEAVAIGLVAAAKMARVLRLLGPSDVTRVEKLLTAVGLPKQITGLKLSAVMANFKTDKKIRQGNLTFVLPAGIGRVKIINDVPLDIVKQVLREIGCR